MARVLKARRTKVGSGTRVYADEIQGGLVIEITDVFNPHLRPGDDELDVKDVRRLRNFLSRWLEEQASKA